MPVGLRHHRPQTNARLALVHTGYLDNIYYDLAVERKIICWKSAITKRVNVAIDHMMGRAAIAAKNTRCKVTNAPAVIQIANNVIHRKMRLQRSSF
jgi:hypothetical protein